MYRFVPTKATGTLAPSLTFEAPQIICNKFQQTTNPKVYASGDVTGPHEIVHVAILQGEVAAKHATGQVAYPVNYDSLVSNPKREIKLLIDWLGWKWDNVYLSPHLNQRSVSTASSIQVRSPINSKSINGWKNYKKILKPAIEIITQIDKYRELIL